MGVVGGVDVAPTVVVAEADFTEEAAAALVLLSVFLGIV